MYVHVGSEDIIKTLESALTSVLEPIARVNQTTVAIKLIVAASNTVD